jgi:DNA repair protein RecO
MSHHIYHTEAIVLHVSPSGEGDRLLYCYTRDMGLIVAHARSIRESRSKLRYALQTFSHAHVDLIEGKYGWKLISATPISSFRHLWKHEGRRRILAQHATLLRRLIQGEERHEALFDEILKGLRALSEITDPELLKDIELYLVVRLLDSLGYWGGRLTPVPELISANGTLSDSSMLRPRRRELIVGINEALHSSQL